MRHLLLAVATIVTLISLVPQPAEARRGEDASEFTIESGIIARQPDVAKALEAARANPGDVKAWRDLGTALSRRGAHDDAFRAFDIAIELNEDDPDSYVDLGAAHIRAGDYGKALGALDDALDIEPFHPLAHYNRGVALQARKDYDDAFDAFRSALLLEPALGDPSRNPGVVNNPTMPYVKLQVYLETAGAAPALFTDADPAKMTTKRVAPR